MAEVFVLQLAPDPVDAVITIGLNSAKRTVSHTALSARDKTATPHQRGVVRRRRPDRGERASAKHVTIGPTTDGWMRPRFVRGSWRRLFGRARELEGGDGETEAKEAAARLFEYRIHGQCWVVEQNAYIALDPLQRVRKPVGVPS